MNPHDSIFCVPPITEVPDYVWSRRYGPPKDTGRRIPHPDAESALQAQAQRHQGAKYLHMDSPTKIILQIMDFGDTIWDTKEENHL